MAASSTSVLFLSGTRGHQIRVRRVALGWRQIDLAYAVALIPSAIPLAEHDRKVPDSVTSAIETAISFGEQDALAEDAT